MANTLIPLLVAELGRVPTAPLPGQLLLYARNGALRIRRSTGSEEDLVLDRKLEAYQKLSVYTPITVNDSVKTAIAKLEAALVAISGGKQGLITVNHTDLLELIRTNKVSAGSLYAILEYPQQQGVVFVQALAPNLLATTGWLYEAQTTSFVEVNVPLGTLSLFAVSGVEPVFDHNWVASLEPGDSFGYFHSGDVVPAKGKTARQLLEFISTKILYPTYTPASLQLSSNQPAVREAGTTSTLVLSTSFSQNDAGVGSNLVLRRLPNQVISPSTSLTYQLVSTDYQASIDYAAGPRKSLQPAGNGLDQRPAQVRSTTAPQAAEAGLRSNVLSFIGYRAVFYGAVTVVPTTSAQVRALTAQLTNQSNQFTLLTGTSNLDFFFALPPGTVLDSITDIDNGIDLLSKYTLQTSFPINDAGAQPVNGYQLYLLHIAVPYSRSARHVVTFHG